MRRSSGKPQGRELIADFQLPIVDLNRAHGNAFTMRSVMKMSAGFGLANLIRWGFFKRLKERERRLHLMKERQMLLEEVKSASFDVEAMPRLVEPASVTETTTRELETISKQTGR